MTNEAALFLYGLAGVVAFTSLLGCVSHLPAKIAAKKRERWLHRASVSELAADCASSARFMGFAEWPAGRALGAKRDWTERDLLAALDELYREAARADPPGVRGHGSNVFNYYDGGFAAVGEHLRERLRISRPSERTRTSR